MNEKNKTKQKTVCFILSFNTTVLMEHGERRVKVEPGVITIPENLQEVKAIKHYSGF